jgi:hypothetical protein
MPHAKPPRHKHKARLSVTHGHAFLACLRFCVKYFFGFGFGACGQREIERVGLDT